MYNFHVIIIFKNINSFIQVFLIQSTELVTYTIKAFINILVILLMGLFSYDEYKFTGSR